MRHARRGSTGGTRKRATHDPEDFRQAVGPVPSHLGLARAFMAKRAHLDSFEIEMGSELVRRAHNEPLSAGQWEWLQEHARAVGAVYEEPDVQPVPAGAIGVQPWGVLPARPPRRVTG